MSRAERGDLNNVAKECSEYEPIQTVNGLSIDYGEEKESEDAGCDSCVHLNNGDCDIYSQRR